MPAVPRCEEEEEDFNGPNRHGYNSPTSADQANRSNFQWSLTNIISASLYPHAVAALKRFLDNSGNTLHVSALEFYNGATDFKNIIDTNVQRMILIVQNEIRNGRMGMFSISCNRWYRGVVEEPTDWRGIYRGYQYLVSGKIMASREMFLYATVFKQYNFDLNETYGNIFDLLGANGNNLNSLYQSGLACNIHIWSRMFNYYVLDSSNGNITYSQSWQNDSDNNIKSLPGYRSNYL
jgi:hypothetical protein